MKSKSKMKLSLTKVLFVIMAVGFFMAIITEIALNFVPSVIYMGVKVLYYLGLSITGITAVILPFCILYKVIKNEDF